LRSGTVPHHLVVGLGKACEVAADEMQSDKAHVTKLARRLYEGITSRLQGVVVNGPLDFSGRTRYPGNLNISFAYVEGESLIMGLKVSASTRLSHFQLHTLYRLRGPALPALSAPLCSVLIFNRMSVAAFLCKEFKD
jgi:cysteine desulfurase